MWCAVALSPVRIDLHCVPAPRSQQLGVTVQSGHPGQGPTERQTQIREAKDSSGETKALSWYKHSPLKTIFSATPLLCLCKD